MNHAAVKRTSGETKSGEPQSKLQTILEKMQLNFYHVEKCVEFSKDVLTESCSKLEELRTQIAELESVIEETFPDNKQHSLDASEAIQRKNRLKRISEQDIIEEITLENDSTTSFGSKNLENIRKKQKTNFDGDEISVITQEPNQRCAPGPSRESTRFANIDKSRSKAQLTLDDKDSAETHFKGAAVVRALQKTKGVLSDHELDTFVYLSDSVRDPVQLAKISFTKDIKMLYFQLMSFHFHLKVANDVIEQEQGASNTNRYLEAKVQSLIHAFQGEI